MAPKTMAPMRSLMLENPDTFNGVVFGHFFSEDVLMGNLNLKGVLLVHPVWEFGEVTRIGPTSSNVTVLIFLMG